MAACEEEGEEDAPRRSEKDDDGSHARRHNPGTAAAPSTDGTGDAVPGNSHMTVVKAGGIKEERGEGKRKREGTI